jgi:hypothetical protein
VGRAFAASACALLPVEIGSRLRIVIASPTNPMRASEAAKPHKATSDWNGCKDEPGLIEREPS